MPIKINVLGKISKYFIKHTQMTFLLMLMLIIAGVSSFYLLPKEQLPEIVFPTLTVTTTYIGANSEDVEQLVTDPIESKLSQLDEIDEMYSVSSEGISIVTVTFKESADIQKKELEADSLLAEAILPDEVDTPDAQIFKTSTLPLMTFSVAGPYDLATLTAFSEDIADELNASSAIDEVTLAGDIEEEIHIVVPEFTLYETGLTMSGIQSAIDVENIDFPVGKTSASGINQNIRVNNRFGNLEDIGNVLVEGNSGQKYFLGEVADIHFDTITQTLINRTFFKDDTSQVAEESVYGTIYRKKGADVISTSTWVRSALEAQRGKLYPSDVTVKIVYDNATEVRSDLGNIQRSAVSGLIVVIMVLFLFIGFRESLIVSITMPMTLLMTLALLSYLGISLNAFAILGLIVALGLLVDNSIIVMENMDRLYKLGYTPYESALNGVNQVALPILASTLTTVAAFFPLAILPGVMGAFINTIPRTIILALLSSLLIAITITPSVYYIMLKRKEKRLISRPNPNEKSDAAISKRWLWLVRLIFIMGLSFIAFYDDQGNVFLPVAGMAFFGFATVLKDRWLNKRLPNETSGDNIATTRYERMLTWLLFKKRRQIGLLFLGVVLLVATGSFIPLGILKVNFFPSSEPTSLTVSIEAPGGTPLEDTTEIVSKVEQILIETPAVEIFNTTIGGQSESSGVVDVTFYDHKSLSYDGFETLAALEQAFKAIPNATIEIAVASQGGPPSGKAISLEFLSDDYEAGKSVADAYYKKLIDIPGVYNASVSVKDSGPSKSIEINALNASLYGLSALNIANQVNARLNGVVITTLKDDQDLIDVRLLYDENKDLDLDEVMIQSSAGAIIPLSAVADIKVSQSLSAIAHTDRQRIITLEADVLEGYNANEINKLLLKQTESIPMPSGVAINVSGEIAQINDSFKDLLRSMVLAVLLVFTILTIQFKSLLQPFAILTTVPMAFIGVFSGLAITKNEFGFYAFMGLVSLVGIAVNDAIVLIDFMNFERREGKSLNEAIISAGKTRFNPVLATTMTTIGGVLPLAFREVYYAQFSYTLVFGLFVTTIMTLVFIPVTYHLLEQLKSKFIEEETDDEAKMA